MRKAAMIVLALLAVRLLPKTLRREARALELITLLWQVTLASGIGGGSGSGTATSKTVNLEHRIGGLEPRVATAQTTASNALPSSGGVMTGVIDFGGGFTISQGWVQNVNKAYDAYTKVQSTINRSWPGATAPSTYNAGNYQGALDLLLNIFQSLR